jgi:hypothetical protein
MAMPCASTLMAAQANRMQDFMVAATLMFGVAFSMVVEAIVPAKISLGVLRAYSIALGAALFLLFSSLWFALQMQRRMGVWMTQ